MDTLPNSSLKATGSSIGAFGIRARAFGRSAAMPAPSTRAYLLWPALVFLASLLVRLHGIGAAPAHIDELLHLYAARSLLSNGTLAIFTGIYARAADFTWLAAGSMALFGDTLAAIRVPSAIAGAALVAATYAWLRGQAGPGPALIVALLLGLMLPAVEISQFARPYAIQSLLFWIAAAAFYALMSGSIRWGRAVAFAALGLVAIAEAARLQVVTLIGVAGLLGWAALDLTWRARDRISVRMLLALWVVAGAGALAFVIFGPGAALYASFRSAQWWATPQRNVLAFYYYEFAKSYGPLLDLLPIAVVTAMAWCGRPMVYCMVVFAAGMALHSIGGMKDARYVSYLLPYFACLWAVAAWAILTWIRDLAVGRLGARAATPIGRMAVLAGLGCLGSAAIVKATPMLDRGVRDLVLPAYRQPRLFGASAAWRDARGTLRPALQNAEVFISSGDLIADYYVGRADLVLNKSRLNENTATAEFSRDYRTGTPIISSDASVRLAMACFKTGLLVSDNVTFGWLPESTQAYIREHTTALAVPAPLFAFHWQDAQGTPPGDCGAIRHLLDRSRRE